MTKTRTLALTPGDPAGIGPDLVVMLANSRTADRIVIIADYSVLTERAKLLGTDVRLMIICLKNAIQGLR